LRGKRQTGNYGDPTLSATRGECALPPKGMKVAACIGADGVSHFRVIYWLRPFRFLIRVQEVEQNMDGAWIVFLASGVVAFVGGLTNWEWFFTHRKS
jgi:hypothetical protein